MLEYSSKPANTQNFNYTRPNLQNSILHSKWEARIPKPTIRPQPLNDQVGYDQEIMFVNNFNSAQPNQTVFLKYTLNTNEIPGPLFHKSDGEYFNPEVKLRLTRELLKGQKHATFKVIAVVDGKMPSEIAQKTYILNENLQPIPIEKEDYIKKADLLNHDTGIDMRGLDFKQNEVLLSGGGRRSVTASPLSADGDFFC